MRFAVVFLCFCPVAFSQNATDNAAREMLKRRIESMKLNPPPALTGRIFVVPPMSEGNSVCAIPLLNALPAQGQVDYKLRIVKPALPDDRTVATRSEVGIPACK